MDISMYVNPSGSELARIGRILMDKATTEKDDTLANLLSRVGDELTRYDDSGGARSLDDLVKRLNIKKEHLLRLFKWAKSQTDTSASKVKDPASTSDDAEKESVAVENTPIGHTDDERNMLRKNLYQLAVYAKETFHMLENLPADADFPHWWQAKVVNSLALMSKAKHYLENELNVPDVNGDRTEESIEEGHGDSEKLSAMKQACGGEEEMVNTLFASAVQNGLDNDDFIDAARRMLNMSANDVKSIIDASLGDKTEESVAEGDEIDENVSRQHFQYVADVLKDMQDPIKRAEYAQHHSAIFQHFNPRFDHARFMAAAGVETKEQTESVCSDCGKPRFAAMPESIQQQYESVNEEKQKGVDGKVCWKGYKRMGTKMKGGKRVDNCVKIKK